MPYSADDASLPEAVKKLPKDKKDRWIAVFNNAIKEYKGDEGKSFAAAWAAIKKDGDMDTIEKIGARHSQKDMALMQKIIDMVKEVMGGEDIEEETEKKDIDPNVGDGNVDRDKLKDSDFLFAQTRSFPIVTAADVKDAVSSFGRSRYRNQFASFKRKLIAMCRRKGFMDALPEEWKKELEKSENLDEKTCEVRSSFMSTYNPQFDYTPVESHPYPLEVWDDGVICAWGDTYYKIPYTKTSDGVQFASRDLWMVVERTWTSVGDLTGVEKVWEAEIIKSDDKHLVYGVVLKPIPFRDSQGDTATEDEVEKTAHDFMVHSRMMDLQHEEELDNSVAVPVESYIAPHDLEINKRVVPKGSWVMVTYIPDGDIWQKVKKGEIRAYSIRGWGVRKEVA